MAEVTLLQEWVLNGQAEEVKDTLVLGSTANMFTDFVPVVFVHLQSFQQKQGLLVGPFPRTGGCSLVLS